MRAEGNPLAIHMKGRNRTRQGINDVGKLVPPVTLQTEYYFLGGNSGFSACSEIHGWSDIVEFIRVSPCRIEIAAELLRRREVHEYLSFIKIFIFTSMYVGKSQQRSGWKPASTCFFFHRSMPFSLPECVENPYGFCTRKERGFSANCRDALQSSAVLIRNSCQLLQVASVRLHPIQNPHR